MIDRCVRANRVMPRPSRLRCMAVPADHATTLADANVPAPPSERGVWLLAVALALLGAVVLGVALASGSSSRLPQPAPPAVLTVASTPTPSRAAPPASGRVTTRAARTGAAPHAIVAQPTA